MQQRGCADGRNTPGGCRRRELRLLKICGEPSVSQLRPGKHTAIGANGSMCGFNANRRRCVQPDICRRISAPVSRLRITFVALCVGLGTGADRHLTSIQRRLRLRGQLSLLHF